MPGQEITVGLRFTADTAAARQQLNSLKQDLMGLGSLQTTQFGQQLTKGIDNATIAAAKLKTQLDAATNIKTGNLDLTKFAKSLKQSGTNLEYYRKELQSLGPEGQQAFMQLANSIQSAEVPLIRVNKLFSSLWDTLKRTAKWQISSSAIHAFMGAVQGAYHYAQDLNESLNNIRIVTGQSTEQMAKFAAQANKAAKTLSTTTTAYTDAALIYYRQGLSDQEVQARADTTIKMANVIGQSAENVSEQMTAVWNNFAKGEEDLELFADKMVALGASTASSSDEIAQGLEKFAAVADTVGLSFDYAAAALTTITATTRQSADTVGTALKTLFSRLESLKLGETLDDDTDLTKYSAALAAVGVNIKDSNGELKKMDTILDETMAKWNSLSKDQQVALANTVAGQRQYAQFIALMDNSDFFKKNLVTEAGASGKLQEQADIYAESWEAARDRVKAAAEGIYTSLINDDFFIEITNGLSKILGFVERLIKSMGGMPGLLATIGTLVLRIAGDQIAQRIRDMAFGFQTIISNAKNVTNIKDEAIDQSYKMIAALGESANPNVKSQAQMYEHLNTLEQELIKNAHKMTEEEIAQQKALIEIQRLREEENLIIQENANQLAKDVEFVEEGAGAASLAAIREQNKVNQSFEENQIKSKSLKGQKGNYVKKLKNIQQKPDESEKDFIQRKQELENKIAELDQEYIQLREAIDLFKTSGAESMETYIDNIEIDINNQLTQQHNIEKALSEYKLVLDEQKNLSENADETQQAEMNEKVTQSFEKLLGAVQAYDDGLAKDMSLQKDSSYNKAVAQEVIDNLTDKLEECVVNEEKELKTLGVSEKTIKKLIGSHRELIQIKQAASKASIEAAKNNNFTVQSYDLIIKNLKMAKVSIKDYANAITAAARTISSISMGINSFIGALKTFSDPDLSTWEKFSTLMMSLPMFLGGIIEGGFSVVETFKSITNAGRASYGVLEGLSQAQQIYNAAQNLSINISHEATGAILSKEAAEKLHGKTLDELLDKEGKQLIAAELKTDHERKEKEGIIAKIIAERTDLKEKEALGPATLIVANAEDTHTASIWKNIAAQIAKHWYILAIVAALGALVGIIYLAVKAENAEAEAAQKAAQTTKEAAEATEESKNKYNELKSSIENLKKSRSTLDSLKEGTYEWKEAVVLLNQEVLDLIKAFPILNKYVSNNNGILSISEEGYEEALSQQLLGIEMGQRQVRSAQIVEQKYDKTDENIKNTGYNTLSEIAKEYQLTGQALNNLSKYIFNSSVEIPKTLTEAKANIAGLNNADLTEQQWDTLYGLLNTIQLALENNTEEQANARKELLLFSKEQLKDNSFTPTEQEFIQAVGAARRQEDNTITTQNYLDRISEETGIKTTRDEIVTWQNSEAAKKQKKQVADDYIAMKNAAQDGYVYEASDYGGKSFTLTRKAIGSDEVEYRTEKGTWSKDKVDKNAVDYGDILAETANFYDHIDPQTIEIANSFKDEVKEITTSFSNGSLTASEYRENLEATAKEMGLNSSIIDEYIGLDKSLQAKYDSEAAIEPLINDLITQGLGTKNAIQYEQEVKEYINSLDEDDKIIFGKFKLDPNSKEDFKKQFEEFKEEYEDQEIDIKVQGEASKYGLNTGVASELAHAFDEINESIADNEGYLKADAEAASDAAVRYQRLNNAVQELYDGFEDKKHNYSQALKEIRAAEASGDETAKILAKVTDGYKGLRKVLADMLNTSEEFINSDFMAQITDSELEKAAMGDAAAIDSIREKLIECSAAAIGYTGDINEVSQALNNLSEGQLLDFSGANNALQEFIEEVIRAGLAAGDSIDLIQSRLSGFGIDLDLEPLYNELDNAVAATASAGEMIIDNLAYDAETNTQTSQDVTTQEETAFEENITPHKPIVVYDQILENSATGTHDVVQSITGFSKTVDTEPVITENKQEKKITAVKIKNAHKSAGGKIANQNKTTTSPKKSSSSGSKGNSGSKRTPKKVSAETDRHHEINEKLDDVSKSLDKIDKLKDRAYGKKHLSAIDAEIEALEKENKLLDEKQAKNLKYLAEDKGLAAAYGAKFDEAGRISNYNDVIKDAVAKYNAGTIDDDQYSAIKDALNKYEESLNLAEDLTEEKAENIRKILDDEFEKVEYTVEIKLEATEFDNKILDWQLGRLEDNDFKSAERIALYAQKANNAEIDYNTREQAIADTLKAAGASQEQINKYFAGDVNSIAQLNNLTVEAFEKIKEHTEGLIESYETLAEMKKVIEEELITSWEKYNEKIDDTIGLYDHLEKKINFYKDVTDVLGVKRLGVSAEVLERMNASLLNINKKRLDSLTEQYNMNNQDLLDAMKNREAAITEEDQQYWDKLIDQISNKMYDIQDSILDIGKNMLDQIKSDFQDTIDDVFAEFEDKMAGVYSSFEEMSEVFDQQKTLKEDYLPEYERLYELNKMNRSLNKEIEKTNSTRNQEKLRDLQKEINKLQASGVEMSKYDLEYLQKKYDLRLAEIALEEAQNNKRTVRLTRDTSGNYNYVYTNDASQVEDMEQKYEDALYSAQKVSEDYINNISESVLKLQKECLDKINQVYKDYSDNLISTAEADRRIQEISDFYKTQMSYMSSELDKALSNNADLYNNEYLNFAETRRLIKLSGDDFTRYFKDTIIGNIMTDYDSLEQYLQTYVTNLGTTNSADNTTVLGKLRTKANQMESDINNVLQTVANTDMKNFADDAKIELDKADLEVDEVHGKVKTLGEDGQTAFSNLSGAVKDAEIIMSPKLSTMASNTETLAKNVKTLNENLGNLPGKISAAANAIDGAQSLVLDNLNKLVDKVNDLNKGYESLINKVGNIEKKYETDLGNVVVDWQNHGWIDIVGQKHPFTSEEEFKNRDKIAARATFLKFYDTGGYTGSWGDSGKLAVLHEKELVLNKSDTENMLATVDIVRRLSQLIDLQNLSYKNQMTSSIKIPQQISNISNNNSNQQVEQNIHIDASFPGVTAKQEIEQAFLELANNASAYMYKY